MRGRALGALAALLVASTPSATQAQGPLPPHIDPAATSRQFDVEAMFSFWGQALDLMRAANHGEASVFLETVESANIPEEIRFTIARFIGLLDILNQDLDAARTELGNAAALIEEGYVEDAESHLKSAESSLEKAGRGLQGLELALGSTLDVMIGYAYLGALVVPPTAIIDQAIFRLLFMFDELEIFRAQSLRFLDQLQRGQVPEHVQMPLPLHTVSLSLEVPPQGYPGREMIISGNVTSPDGPDPIHVHLRLLLGNTLLEEFNGPVSFQRLVALPTDVLEGEHILSLEFPLQEPYAAASVTQEVLVVKLQPDLRVHAPGLMFFSRTVRVSGQVTSIFGPLPNTRVTLALGGGSITIRTDTEGSFSNSLNLPLLGLFLGPQSLQVEVSPQEAWYGPVEREIRLFIVNATSLILLSLVGAYGIVLLGLSLRRRRGQPPKGSETPMPGVRAPDYVPVLGIQPFVPSLAFAEEGSPRAQIISSYHRAAQLLVTRKVVPLRSSFTLRDFLRALGARIGSAFVELTGLAEGALYRSRQPDPTEATQAEQLSRQVEEEP